MTPEQPFTPLSDDLCRNSPEANAMIPKLIHGEISILRLFRCDPELFAKIQAEVRGILSSDPGQMVDGDHPTYKFVSREDPSWKPKPNSLMQHSLYNSKDDVLYFKDDHHWSAVERKFNSRLVHIPEFFRRYFGDSELQNVRMQSITGGGTLGKHREKIIAIPGREHNWKLRFHLPIFTNPGVKFLMDEKPYTMEAGWVYTFNQSCLHGVANDGNELRTHLYWDYYLNDHIMLGIIAKPFAEAKIRPTD